MTDAQRTKLIGVLGRLGSPFDGERAAAGLLATRLLAGAGLTWDALIGRNGQRPIRDRAAGEQRAAAIAACQQRHQWLTPWEREFLHGVRHRRTLSAKQLAMLLQIADELPTRAAP